MEGRRRVNGRKKRGNGSWNCLNGGLNWQVTGVNSK